MLLQDELRAYPGYLLARARAQAFRAFDNAVGAPFELRPVEFSVLVLLKSNAQASPAQLAASLHVAAPNLTGILRRLEERGLVQRTRSEEDKRVQHIELTAAGQDTVQRAMSASRDMDRQWMARLSNAEQAMLLELLGKLMVAPAAVPAAPLG